MALPYEFIQELNSRNNIADVVSSYVSLKRMGSKLFGLCPFHGEKTPSFNVVPEDGYFHCFGCGVGGDAITFIMKIENLDYIEAVKFLAQRCGMDMPENSYDADLSNLRRKIYEINRETARFYYNQLYTPTGKEALEYLRSRALTERTIKHFGLGYSPKSQNTLTQYLKGLGYKENDIIQANLAVRTNYGKVRDRFFDRVMFPIIDLRGNVIAFGGRLMGDGKPKYLNTSDTLVFKKSTNLFALNKAKNQGQKTLILAEGYMDVIAMHQAGFTNAVATLGTALTEEQAMLIKRYSDEVIICYDADEAGQKASQRAIGILRKVGVLIKVLNIPNAKDPDEYIKANGAVKFKNLLEKCGNDIEYRLEKIKRNYNLEVTEDKIQYLTEIAKILAELENDIERDIYTSKLSNETGVQKDALTSQINKYLKKTNYNNKKKEFRDVQIKTSARQDKVNPQKQNNLRVAKAEEGLIAYILKNPEYAEKIVSVLPIESFITDFNRSVYKAITDVAIITKNINISELTEKFTQEEISVIVGFKVKYEIESNSKETAKEYIKIIKKEKDKLNVRNSEDVDIASYLNNLKEQKK